MKLEECIDQVKSCVRKFADPRQGNNKSYSMEEIGMAAYSVFHLQSPSFLSHQKNMKRKKSSHNGKMLFGFSNIPSDNHIRQVLDSVSPSAMTSFFDYALGAMNLEEC